MRRIAGGILVIMVLYAGSLQAEELVVRHIQPESETDQRYKYYVDLLKIALQKTESTDGPFRTEMADKPMFQGRALVYLEKGEVLDVVWTMTTAERERRLLPIRIPLLKGLLGHRIFLINQEDREKFAAVETLDDLKQFRAGQGHDWPDTEILKANGLNVITAATYEGLFDMLERHRFDYFPRGVNEPWAELRTHSEKGFVIEETILLQYPAPIYFFVNPKDKKLAHRIERGLRIAIADGTFGDFLRQHPISKDIFEKAHLENRKIFKLKNPFLTPETPLDQEELWYTP